MIEKRFPGIDPIGLSPIIPKEWFPAGLKYLKAITFQSLWAVAIDFNSNSTTYLDSPYGVMGLQGNYSVQLSCSP